MMLRFRKLRGISDSVVIESSRVKKKLDCEHGGQIISVERAARVLGEKSGVFRVPVVLDVEQGEGCLYVYYEKIDGLTSLALQQDGSERFEKIVTRCGRALAIIHSGIVVTDEVRVQSKRWSLSGDPEVVLHGDFSTLNIGLSDGDLYIWDWVSARAWGEYANVGSASVDLSAFLFTLFMYGNSFFQSVISYKKWLTAFLRGYEDCACLRVNRRILARGMARLNGKVVAELWRNRSFVACFANLCGGVFCVMNIWLWKGVGNDDGGK